MEIAVLFMTHLMALGMGAAVGRWLGYTDAQPKRDKNGRFLKKG